MAFEIESGVPVAVRRGRKGTQFPFINMEIGDSFLIPCDTNDKKALDSWRRKVATAKKQFLKSYEGSFQVATVEGGLRVWRTK